MSKKKKMAWDGWKKNDNKDNDDAANTNTNDNT